MLAVSGSGSTTWAVACEAEPAATVVIIMNVTIASQPRHGLSRLCW